jgi:hypothetical protein
VLPSLLSGGRTALYVDRDGVLIWGGIIWGGSRKKASHSVEIQALEFESYLYRRLITKDYRPATVDQFTISRTLIAAMQAPSGGDIGILLGAGTSGVLRTRDFFRTDLQTVWDAVHSLTEMEFGFDISIDVAYDSSGTPAKTLNMGYPRLGSSAAQTGLDFQNPGSITDWTDDFDAFSSSATDLYELGQGGGSTTMIAHASDPSSIAAGWPILDAKDSTNRNVSTQPELDALAREALLTAPIPVQTYSCEVKANADPVFGSYIPGDAARFRLFDDEWHKPLPSGEPGFDAYLRILGFTDNPTTERVTLSLGDPR